jgi:hypothetical protein
VSQLLQSKKMNIIHFFIYFHFILLFIYFTFYLFYFLFILLFIYFSFYLFYFLFIFNYVLHCSLQVTFATYSSPLMNIDMIVGVDVSNPAKLSVFRSFGSAIVRQLLAIPTTISLASIPIFFR